MKNKQLVRRVVAHFGGQPALAKKLGVTQQAVSYWCCRLEYFPVEHVLAVESLLADSGSSIDRYQLRPDIYGEQPGSLAKSA